MSLETIGPQNIALEIKSIQKFDTKKEAVSYEKWLKSGVGREFVKTIFISAGFISAAADGSSILLSLLKGRFSVLFSYMNAFQDDSKNLKINMNLFD